MVQEAIPSCSSNVTRCGNSNCVARQEKGEEVLVGRISYIVGIFISGRPWKEATSPASNELFGKEERSWTEDAPKEKRTDPARLTLAICGDSTIEAENMRTRKPSEKLAPKQQRPLQNQPREREKVLGTPEQAGKEGKSFLRWTATNCC